MSRKNHIIDDERLPARFGLCGLGEPKRKIYLKKGGLMYDKDTCRECVGALLSRLADKAEKLGAK